MKDFRPIAAAMDQRVRQLANEGITSHELINRMAGHMPELQRIWEGTSDSQLATLCQDYPGFYQYASVMEEAAEAERVNPGPLTQAVPELNDALKPLLLALLTDAATLERGYQSVIDAPSRRGMGRELDELNHRHRTWLGDRERFFVALNEAGVPKIVLEVVGPGLDQMADRIIQLESRALAESGAGGGRRLG